MIYFEEKTGKGMKYCAASVDKGYIIVIYKYIGRGTRWFWAFTGEKLRRVNAGFIRKIAPDIHREIKEHAGLRSIDR